MKAVPVSHRTPQALLTTWRRPLMFLAVKAWLSRVGEARAGHREEWVLRSAAGWCSWFAW